MKLGNHSGRLPNLQFLQVNSKQSFRACPSRRKSAKTLQEIKTVEKAANDLIHWQLVGFIWA